MVQGLQARRGAELWKALDGRAHLAVADSVRRREAALTLEGSPPLAHGLEGTTLGYLVALTVVDHAERERFVFASDVQGPLSPVAAAWIIRQQPTLLYLAGPPSYMEHALGAEVIDRGAEHLRRIIATTGCRVVMDHYALRDPHWRERFGPLLATGRVTTAAGYLGLPEATLEAQRRELWGQVRRPAVKAPGTRAIITTIPTKRIPRRAAKGEDTQ
jgi:predicted metallo-beta-lactamase superfamily hydrolase